MQEQIMERITGGQMNLFGEETFIIGKASLIGNENRDGRTFISVAMSFWISL